MRIWNTIALATMLYSTVVSGQGMEETLTLERCYEKAEANYPLTKQRDLLHQSSEYSVANASTGYWPMVSIQGQASYQSDVTQIPISLPGFEAPTIPKNQYKIYAEIYQPLTDVYAVTQQKHAQAIHSKIQQQNLEVELYQLRDRIDQIYFGVLLMNEQIQQVEILRSDLSATLSRTRAAIECALYGVRQHGCG